MNKAFLVAIAFLSVFISFSVSGSQPAEFRTDVGKFSIIAPSPFQEVKVPVVTPAGNMDVLLFKTSHGKVNYTIICMDSLPTPLQSIQPLLQLEQNREKALDELCNRMVKKLKGSVVSETAFALEGNPGREVTLEFTDEHGKASVMKLRAVFAKNRLYQLMAAASHEELAGPEVKSFFDSFKPLAE